MREIWSSVKTLLEELNPLTRFIPAIGGVNIVGIYKIKNTINNKIYIGQSGDIKWRWTHHRSDLRGGYHSNKHLQGAWKKYGEDAFEFSIVEETTKEKLNERERYWITYYDSVNSGYNFDYGGDGVYGYKHSDEEINKMRRIQSPNIILQFDKDCKFIKEWIGGSSHIRKELGYTKECILLRCDHKIKTMSPYKDSYWVYKEEYFHQDFTWEKYFLNKKIIEITKLKNRENKRICQYDKHGEYIKTWNSLKEIRNAGYNTSPISTILHFGKGKKSSQGYIWAFEGYDFSDGYFDTLIKPKIKEEIPPKPKLNILKIDCDTLKCVAVFDCLKDAAESCNLANSTGISHSANHPYTHKSGGYYWIYNYE